MYLWTMKSPLNFENRLWQRSAVSESYVYFVIVIVISAQSTASASLSIIIIYYCLGN